MSRKSANGKSVQAVCALLDQTPEMKTLVSMVQATVESATIVGLSYNVRPDEQDERRRVNAAVKVRFNTGTVYTFSVAPDSVGVHMFYNGDQLRHVVDTNFGVSVDPRFKRKKVPTFGVKKDNILDKYIDHGPKTITTALEETCRATALRLKDDIRALLVSEEADAGKRRAWEDHVVLEIKKVLMRFKSEPQEIIKRALDEFICHEITES